MDVSPHCVDLAREALLATPAYYPVDAAQAARDLVSLAEHIQHAIDDWFARERD